MPIRKLRISDIEALHRLFAEVSAEGEYLLRAEAPPLEKMRALLLRSLPLDLPQFVVDAEGDLVGSIEIFPASLCRMGDGSGRTSACSACRCARLIAAVAWAGS